MLSPESQAALTALLPPTAFRGFQSSLEPNHPSVADCMVVDQPPSAHFDMLDRSMFTDPHFLAAARTFQGHIYSDWMSDAHREKVNKFQAGIRDGTLAAAWKDDVWEMDNKPSQLKSVEKTPPLGNVPESLARAGEAAEVRLVTLLKNEVIRVGDVIAYKRNFPGLNVSIEKDAIIQSIHPKTYAMTVLVEPGSTKHLSPLLLSPQQLNPSTATQSMTITSPTMLETGLLDIDGRVERSKRPNGNAWKCFTIWRWRGEPVYVDDGRGGRENHGTMFYLRSTYYHER